MLPLLQSASAAAPVPHAAAAHASSFLPHGFCYLWNPPLLWTHLLSDLVIGGSYVVISFALAALVHRARRDIPFSVVFVAFGLFIITCGMTHFMEIWTLWQPVYWLSGGVKVVTAIASASTAAVMPFMIPRVHATIRDAKLSRAREVAAARVAALEEANDLLQQQAVELEEQREEAQSLTEELELANAELHRALAEAEAARAAADAANRAKGEFLATMSHELRTPLNAIGGYAELLEMGVRGPVTETQRSDLARIRRSQQHLLALVTDVLTFSRVEAARLPYAVADVPLGAVLHDVSEMIRPQAAAKGLAYAEPACAPDLAARGDADKVRQVLLNLLSNAVKYTEPGGRITVACSADAGAVTVSVADTGIGIPADRRETIFEPFVQLDQGLTRRAEGAGLGLAIARELARGMGGELSVESMLGAGSTFTLTLPRA